MPGFGGKIPSLAEAQSTLNQVSMAKTDWGPQAWRQALQEGAQPPPSCGGSPGWSVLQRKSPLLQAAALPMLGLPTVRKKVLAEVAEHTPMLVCWGCKPGQNRKCPAAGAPQEPAGSPWRREAEFFCPAPAWSGLQWPTGLVRRNGPRPLGHALNPRGVGALLRPIGQWTVPASPRLRIWSLYLLPAGRLNWRRRWRLWWQSPGTTAATGAIPAARRLGRSDRPARSPGDGRGAPPCGVLRQLTKPDPRCFWVSCWRPQWGSRNVLDCPGRSHQAKPEADLT